MVFARFSSPSLRHSNKNERKLAMTSNKGYGIIIKTDIYRERLIN